MLTTVIQQQVSALRKELQTTIEQQIQGAQIKLPTPVYLQYAGESITDVEQIWSSQKIEKTEVQLTTSFGRQLYFHDLSTDDCLELCYQISKWK